MLECCRAERSTQFQIGAKLPFCDRHRLLFIGPSRGRSNLFRMIFLYQFQRQLPCNDILARKHRGGGVASSKALAFGPRAEKAAFGAKPIRMSTCEIWI